MTTEVSTLSAGNFAEMAKAMGMTTDMSSGSSKQSTFNKVEKIGESVNVSDSVHPTMSFMTFVQVL